MRITAICCALIALGANVDFADAGHKTVIREDVGPQTMPGSNTTLVNKATITGGTEPGIKVTGSNNTVINKGTITGSTGIKVTGGGSVTIVNRGTIRNGISIGGWSPPPAPAPAGGN